MNLRAIANRSTQAINPNTPCTIRQSDGTYTTLADGTRVPNYRTFLNVPVQIQGLAAGELAMVEGLNLQGVRNAAYLNGQWAGVVRSAGKGGDLIVTPDGQTWLVAIIAESWPDWTKIIIVLQTDPVAQNVPAIARVDAGVAGTA